MSFADILANPEAGPLFAEYAAECSLPEIGSIAPQADLYAVMERGGSLRTFGVFRKKQLIGFASLLVYVLPHYGRKVASTESIFIAAAERNTGAGKQLLAFIEHYAHDAGCQAVLYSAPTGSQFARVLAAQRKYRHSNDIFIRKLA